MLEVLRLVLDDLVGNTALIHPRPEDRNESAGVRLLGHGREQDHIEPFAPAGQFDDHCGGIDPGAPGRDHRLARRGHHATIASQRSGQAGGRMVTL